MRFHRDSTRENPTRNTLIWVVFLIAAIGTTAFLMRMINISADRSVSARLDRIQAHNAAYNGAILETSAGNIHIAFYSQRAPLATENFIRLSERDFYNGTKFHRVIADFMIQGGDPLTKTADRSQWGAGGPGYTFKDEISDLPMERGMVAMANHGPDTNGSQFFILVSKAPWLDGKHTIFAKVTDGMEVADAISMRPTDDGDIPIRPPTIEDIELQ